MKADDRIRYLEIAIGDDRNIEQETGCGLEDLRNGDLEYNDISVNSKFSSGWFAARTCSQDFNLTINYPNNRGNLQFWFGVMAGMKMREDELNG